MSFRLGIRQSSMRLFQLASFALLANIICFAENPAPVETTQPKPYSLARGYNDAYNLDFAGAQQQFSGWERSNPRAALGPVSEAAGLLFSEFDRLGVLQTEFFADDQHFA